ncbi:MAG: hypothetical protein H6Q07_3154, partial [Acidobacteria bacterium]|nr:hypothetical protein [Acidobacteriota bacterium]
MLASGPDDKERPNSQINKRSKIRMALRALRYRNFRL